MELLVAVAVVLIVACVLLVRARRAGVRRVDAEPARGLEDIRALAAERRTIDAIKAYRELRGGGLKEARDAVEALARGESPAAVPPAESYSDADIEAEVRAGNLIGAIRRYRGKTGAGLAEARSAVEALCARLERR